MTTSLAGMAALLGASFFATPVSAQTAYTGLHFDKDPIASAGSLGAGQSAPSVIRAKNGTAPAPGAVVYLSYTTTVPGDSVTVPGSQCGGVTTLSSQPTACTTDSGGQVALAYVASATPPAQGLVDIRAADSASSARIATDTHYVYCTVYRLSRSPMAASGSLASGASVVVSVSAEDALNAQVPNTAVYLSFTAASGGGHAAVGSTPLTASPTLYHTDSTGHIQVSYTAPATLPATGVDSILVQDRPSSPTSFTSDSYAFSAAVPVVSIGDSAAIEGDAKPGIPIRNTLTLSSPQPTPVTVQYTTQCGVGDKTCSEDFHEVHSPLTVTFPANTTHASIVVRVFSYVGNFGGETYNEGYFVHLVNPSGAILGRSVGAGMILPDVESSLAQMLYVGDSSQMPIAAGKVPVGFTVTLTGPQSTAVSFNYATSDGTAVANVDYAPISGTVVIPAGSNSAVITVNWLAQAPPTSNKTFNLTISNASGGLAIARTTGTGTILAG